MNTQTTLTYQCPNCAAGLVFDPAKGKLCCEFCLSEFTEQEVLQANEAMEAQEAASAAAEAAAHASEQVDEEYCAQFSDYQCASCGAENSAKAAQCIKCHKPLHVYCPKCGTDNNNVAQNCAKCHFSLMDMPRALPLIAKAKEALKQHQLAAAEQAVQQAEEFWPNHPDLLEAKSRLTQLQQQENDALSGIRAAIEKKEIVQARDLMTRARNNGIALPAEYSAHVKAVLEGVNAALAYVANLG